MYYKICNKSITVSQYANTPKHIFNFNYYELCISKFGYELFLETINHNNLGTYLCFLSLVFCFIDASTKKKNRKILF